MISFFQHSLTKSLRLYQPARPDNLGKYLDRAHIAGTVNAPAVLVPLHNLGNFGVTIFFVISGFLITVLLLEELRSQGKISIRGFYQRRIFRIFPAFYFYIALVLLANSLGYLDLYDGDVLHAVTFTMNYHHERAWAFNHTWSLAVEEQFYLFWPLDLPSSLSTSSS